MVLARFFILEISNFGWSTGAVQRVNNAPKIESLNIRLKLLLILEPGVGQDQEMLLEAIF